MLFYLLSVLGLVPTFQKSKCKRLLNKTLERIKLLERRRQAQLRQLHGDVIELLQRGKEHKVQPWLQRIWKELCLLSVYIKIADYCQTVQIHLKDIAGQRECPSGLEEPLAGLCFAASCCADLPELQELREIFAMKYGNQFVDSTQELQPTCHLNQQFLECLCPKDPSEMRKQALLAEITTQFNVKHGHEQETQRQRETDNSSSIESSVDANECNQSSQGKDKTMKASEVEDQSESEELQEVDGVQESHHMDTVGEEENGGKENGMTADCKAHDCVHKDGQGDEVCSDTGSRFANVHHDGYEGCGTLQGEGITAHMNEDVAPDEDQRILLYAVQLSLSQPPQRPPPPPPPPKRVPPPLPISLQVVSMPSSYNDKQEIANTSLPLRCSTMANNYFLETCGSHVHPRLPKYEDLVARFSALKC